MQAHIGKGAEGLFLALSPPSLPTIFFPLDLKAPWQTGQVVEAHVRRLRVGAEGGGGFCEGIDGTAYFLRRTQGLSEGQSLHLHILGEARGHKPALAEVTETELKGPSLSACLAKFGFKGAFQTHDLSLLTDLRAAFPLDQFEWDAGDPLPLALEAEERLEQKVLPCANGQVIFESTKTAHLFDVDGQGSLAALNGAAVEMIAAHLIACNLGGLIVIDFLPPATKDQRRGLTQAMEARLAPLPHRVHIHPMTASGHLLIERQRLGPEFILKETYHG